MATPRSIPPPRRVLRGEGRERIFAEAIRLFGARDFSDVSMQDVADAAGVTKAALYYHFKDKVDLYYHTLIARVDAVREAMEVAVGEGGSLEERLMRLARVGIERLESDVYRPHLHSHQHLDEARHADVYRAIERLQEPLIRSFVKAGVADPKLSPQAAAALFGGLIGSLTFAGFDDNANAAGAGLPRDRQARVALAVGLFLRGYWSLAEKRADPDACRPNF